MFDPTRATLQHEQSLADAFNGFMREQALELGGRVHSFSLDGQDRDAGADYLLTDANRFALVEFKYLAEGLKSENRKSRRLCLCTELAQREDMRALHDSCHFIAWQDNSCTVQTNIYRREICNRSIFGSDSGLADELPFSGARATAGAFAKGFLADTGTRSLSLRDFEEYLAWLLTQTSGSMHSTLELVTRNADTKDLALVRFNSVAAAQSWLQDQFPPSPMPRRRPRG
jgi:hypothetical protein